MQHETGTRCHACGAFATTTLDHHDCLAYRRFQSRTGFAGVIAIAGRRYVSKMDARGNMAERREAA